ncbi:MAG TPA: 16S rRNA methyltransferase [Candidatus Bathyarchaeota archaeon]|nr:16S rRNA methyltransferase [Candidatus Bathyarchaeota archaeon]
MLILVLAEAALETVPEELWSHPAVRHHSKRQRKPPQQLLLDRSLHHSAMKQLDDDLKRGRPDITHFALLEALGSPLNKEGLLQTYVHTNKDLAIKVNPATRLPRNYNRFIGLVEQLFQQGMVPSTGETLLTLQHKTLKTLLAEAEADYILALSREGKHKTLQDAVSTLQTKQRPAVIVGGFPHGHLSETATQLADEIVCIDSEMLEAWTVTSRVIYEYERSLSVPKKRLCEN